MEEGPKVMLNVIDIIGRREYSGKIVWLREYIQNAIDAGSSDYIKISLHGRDLEIIDKGNGMDIDELNRQAFTIGGSQKNPNQIGELGIGIYAATGICDRMTVLTKKDGKNTFQAILDTNKYRRLIKLSPMPTFDEGIRKVLSITENNLPQNDWGSHFTIIRFENLNDEAIIELEKEKLIKFITETVDLPLSDTFPKKSEVLEFLGKSMREIKVIIDYEGDIIEPKKYDYIYLNVLKYLYKKDIKVNNKIVSKVWAIYSSKAKDIPYAGIFVKRKGLTVVKDGGHVASLFGAKYEARYLAEIVILDDNIEINTSRDWFISNKNLEELIKGVRSELNNLWSIANLDSKDGIGIYNLYEKLISISETASKNKEDNNIGKYNEELQKINEIKTKINRKVEEAKKIKEKVEHKKLDTLEQSDKIKLEIVKNALNNLQINNYMDNNIKTNQDVIKPRQSPWPKQVLTFLKLNVIDKNLSESVGNGDIKDVSDRAFTFIEQKVKVMLGKQELERVDWKELLGEFKKKYDPPDLKGFPEGDYIKSFNEIMNGFHTILRNPSNHSFMKDRNNPRNTIQIMLIADFIVQWLDQWQQKQS